MNLSFKEDETTVQVQHRSVCGSPRLTTVRGLWIFELLPEMAGCGTQHKEQP